MDFTKAFRVQPGTTVNLRQHATSFSAGFKKSAGLAQTTTNQQCLNELQERLYAGHAQSLLIVLQGMDAAGKDGTIKAVGGAMNPQGIQVTSYKVPNAREADQDFLWRIHRDTPGKGLVSLFNRSQYEEVLIVRVRGSQPEKFWQDRFEQINSFEKILAANGTHILKFFLHISPEEQLKRLAERIDDPAKNWKVTEADFSERQRWNDYQRAYEQALSHTSTAHAPWFIIPADRKWFRNLAVTQIVADHLAGLNMQYPKSTADLDAIRKKYLPPRP